MTFSAADKQYMGQALALAQKAANITSPNPSVGCVIVLNDRIIGYAYTQPSGGHHAEALALRLCKEVPAGATVYVTLEPCCHTGKTPPCTQALINAEVHRVVVAVEDPNPLVAGKGIEQLREAGILVDVGLLAMESVTLNTGFFQRMQLGRPRITIKSAMSMDGRTAMASGESKWITGSEARRDVQRLRASSCAILTGIETVLSDDPSMNVRLSSSDLGQGKYPVRQPLRVILDSSLRTDAGAKIIGNDDLAVCLFSKADDAKVQSLSAVGVQCVKLKSANPGKNSGLNLEAVMAELTKRECNEVLVEAGPTLAGALIEAGYADRLVIYIAPNLMGDGARPLFCLPNVEEMHQRRKLEISDIKVIGKDIRVTAGFRPSDQTL